jgi:pimeloyl-ACP methyl ester carboxylesterase
MRKGIVCLAVAAGLLHGGIEEKVRDGYADSGGVKIHYVTAGQGPLVVMVHGFPDFWYSWRHQMEALADRYQVVAIDQRGYNLSDKPKGVEQYDISLLAGDVAAVIRHLGKERAVVVGHDWGGMVAWTLAMTRPEMVERLVIVNLPHPGGLRRELAGNPEQQKNSQYARDFQKEGAHLKLTAEALAKLAPEAERAKYTAAFQKSDFEAMLNYYKRNYPREPYTAEGPPLPKVKMPVLMFHGLKDKALLAGALNGTWDWLESDLTLVTIPNAGHWAHWDAAALVSGTMRSWLENGRKQVAEAMPKGVRVSTWVREDLFAGFMVNDMERLERGEAKLAAILAETPGQPDALAWLGGAALYRAILEHEAGRAEAFREQYAKAKELFQRAEQSLKGDDYLQAVLAIRGGSWTVFADRLPEELRTEGWRQVKANYSALKKEQGMMFSRYPAHMKGEVLSGLAQASIRLGEKEEGEKQLRDLIQSMANTPYGARAKRWQEAPETVAKTSITCQSCHEEGRLANVLASRKAK